MDDNDITKLLIIISVLCFLSGLVSGMILEKNNNKEVYNLMPDTTYTMGEYPNGETVIDYIGDYKVFVDGTARAIVFDNCSKQTVKVVYNIADTKQNDDGSIKVTNIDWDRIKESVKDIK